MSVLLTLLVAGLALGATYALVVLGVVVINRSTGIFNFAHGGFVILGAYLTYNAHATWGLPFYVALVVGMIGCAALGYGLNAGLLRGATRQGIFVSVMVTFGVLIIIQEIPTIIWGPNNLTLGDPWRDGAFQVGGVTLETRDLAAITLCVVTAGLLGTFFRLSDLGLAMRAAALDAEAAMAQGVSLRRVSGLAWAVGGAIGALGGVVVASGASANLSTQIGFLLLLAFPAMVLGGLDSPIGAVAGSVILGILQTYSQAWETGLLHWLPAPPSFLGTGFNEVIPFLLMIVILLLRPYGLMGTRQVRRL